MKCFKWWFESWLSVLIWFTFLLKYCGGILEQKFWQATVIHVIAGRIMVPCVLILIHWVFNFNSFLKPPYKIMVYPIPNYLQTSSLSIPFPTTLKFSKGLIIESISSKSESMGFFKFLHQHTKLLCEMGIYSIQPRCNPKPQKIFCW
jgi:hypothetical protein